MIDVAGFSVGLAETLAAMGTPAHNDMLERVRILPRAATTPAAWRRR